MVSWIEKATERIDELMRKTRRELTLLLEFRTRVVSDVVTGKFDVREVAARLPEEAVEAEPLDEIQQLAEDEEPTEDTEQVIEDAI